MTIHYQEFELELAGTSYPFTPTATLTNGTDTVPSNLFVDCVFYLARSDGRLYLSSVDVSSSKIRLTIGIPGDSAAGVAEINVPVTASRVTIFDRQGRAAGLLVSSPDRLGVLSSWGVGAHLFTPEQTEFCLSCYHPSPPSEVTGIRLPDGSTVSGEVWLVGADGIILTTFTDSSGNNIQFNAVGDPLFTQKECTGTGLFAPIQPVRQITVVSSNGTFTCTPSNHGNFSLQMNNALNANTALRLHTTDLGIVVEVAGSNL